MSIFTRRNYVWLASVARDMRDLGSTDSPIAHEAVACAINTLADALEVESPNFDKQKFLKDVFGVGGWNFRES